MERISLEQALDTILAAVRPLEGTISSSLFGALGRCSAEDIYAPLDNPPFDRSPLDGFSLRSEDTVSASADNPAVLRVKGGALAGKPADCQAAPGEAIRIATGAVIPGGCDCVVPLEIVREEGGKVFVFCPLSPYENYIRRGSDIGRGQLLVRRNDRLDFIRLGILAAVGVAELRIMKPPVIGLLCTGDELTPPGRPLSPGGIYDSNQTLLSCRLKELGFEPVVLPSGADDADRIVREINDHIDELDLLITTGGVSVGEKDMLPAVFDKLSAERLFRGMDFKPGSAVLCGLYRGKPLVSLSGNPFAGITTFELLVKPLLAKLTGRKDLEPRRRQARLKNAFPKGGGGQRRFIRARLDEDGAALPEGHASGQLLSFLGCNCFVDIPAGRGPLPAGASVNIVLL
jgi:molybdopterin molybdotransferase